MYAIRSYYAHTELFGTQPKIMVIHAGLECGLFKACYPHWDMVSFGPTIQGAHSPDERVHIPAVQHFWQLLVRLVITSYSIHYTKLYENRVMRKMPTT